MVPLDDNVRSVLIQKQRTLKLVMVTLKCPSQTRGRSSCGHNEAIWVSSNPNSYNAAAHARARKSLTQKVNTVQDNGPRSIDCNAVTDWCKAMTLYAIWRCGSKNEIP